MIIFASGMAIGLYSGKKRAAGKTWREVFSDMLKDVRRNADSAWNKAAGLFSRDVKPEDEYERNEGAGAGASDET
jgi:hypothetical protein